MSGDWIRVADALEIEIGGATVARYEGHQIAVFRLGESDFRAVDNLCPHEGYPLVQGYVKKCVLTCAWHNFKFDLSDGRCVQGDEDVRVYPVRVKSDSVEVDISDVASSVGDAQWTSLRAGLQDRTMPRIARDVVRMLQAGVPPAELLMFAVCYDAEYAEFGSTHALPVGADLLALLPQFDGMDATLPIMQAMEQAAEDSVRRDPRPTPDPIEPTAGEDAGRRLFELIETEDLVTAEGLLRGAIRRGATRADVEPWFFRLVTEHFLGFGHSLIYVAKVFDLLEATGWKHSESVLSSLLFSIGTSTREDTLPTMIWLRESLDTWGGAFSDWMDNVASADWNRDALVDLVLSGKRHDVAGGVRDALASGVSPRQVVDAISLAAAHRMLRFDVSIDGDPGVREGWLDTSHGLTFAQATRVALQRYREPGVLRLLFFAAHFVNRTSPLDLAEDRQTPWDQLPTVQAARLRERVLDAVFGDHYTRPIVVAHVLKTGLAALSEHQALGDDPQAVVPLLAARRLLDSPLRERQVRRNSEEAVRFIGAGKPPRRLTTAP